MADSLTMAPTVQQAARVGRAADAGGSTRAGEHGEALGVPPPGDVAAWVADDAERVVCWR